VREHRCLGTSARLPPHGQARIMIAIGLPLPVIFRLYALLFASFPFHRARNLQPPSRMILPPFNLFRSSLMSFYSLPIRPVFSAANFVPLLFASEDFFDWQVCGFPRLSRDQTIIDAHVFFPFSLFSCCSFVVRLELPFSWLFLRSPSSDYYFFLFEARVFVDGLRPLFSLNPDSWFLSCRPSCDFL